MTESPLFERIPPRQKTYDELVELLHYYRRQWSIAENRLSELIAIVQGAGDDLEAAFREADEQILGWERYDREHPE